MISNLPIFVVISGALTLLHDEFDMTSVEKELVVGATTFGAIFGGFGAGIVSLLYLHTHTHTQQILIYWYN